MKNIKYIKLEITPSYFGDGTDQLEVSLEWFGNKGAHTATNVRLIDYDDFESRFDYYMRHMTEEIKALVAIEEGK